MAGAVNVAVMVPFAAGKFLYIAAADLLPHVTTSPRAGDKIVHTVSFIAGLGLLYLVAAMLG